MHMEYGMDKVKSYIPVLKLKYIFNKSVSSASCRFHVRDL